MIRALSIWAPLAAYLGLIFWLSSIPQAELPTADFRFSDKVVHVIEYAVAGALLARAFASRLTGRRLVLAAALAGALYGVTDEIHQGWYPERHRNAAADDVVADAIGALVGAWAWARLARRKAES